MLHGMLWAWYFVRCTGSCTYIRCSQPCSAAGALLPPAAPGSVLPGLARFLPGCIALHPAFFMLRAWTLSPLARSGRAYRWTMGHLSSGATHAAAIPLLGLGVRPLGLERARAIVRRLLSCGVPLVPACLFVGSGEGPGNEHGSVAAGLARDAARAVGTTGICVRLPGP